MEDVEKLYNGDEPVTVEALQEFGLLDGVFYEDQMLELLNNEMNKRYRKEVAGKPWNRASSGTKATTKGKKNTSTVKKKKKSKLINPSKTIIPVTTYLRRTRRNEVEGVPGRTGDKTIAVINAEGAIVNAAGPGSGANLQVDNFREQANAILKDNDVDGVVVRISSPGGDALASDLMWREVRRLRESGKVVVASVCNVAASGGYYIAMGCETIVCDELSITGSIGVVQAKFAAGEFLDKIGLKIERVSKGKYAELFAAERGFTPAEDAYWSKNAMNSYEDFVAKAAMSRRMPLEDMKRRAQGRVWTGSQAKALGLVDELGGLDRAVEVCRDMVDLKKLATKKMVTAERAAAAAMKKKEREEGKGAKKDAPAAKEEVGAELKGDVDSTKNASMAIVKTEKTEEAKDGDDESEIVLSDEDIPFGPLGIFPELYSDLQAQVVQEAKDEIRAQSEKATKGGKERQTRVKNIQPSSGVFSLLSSSSRQEGGLDDIVRRLGLAPSPQADKPSSSNLLKGLGSLMSPEAARPMAVMDDDLARSLPGVSGVPQDLKRLGVGPLLHSFLLRSPGLAESLVETLGKVGLSSLLLD